MKNKKEINKLMKEIEKDFGKGTLMNLSGTITDNIEVISTGSLLLDAMISRMFLHKYIITHVLSHILSDEH